MSDQIKIEELKLFVGTGLKVNVEWLDGGYGSGTWDLDQVISVGDIFTIQQALVEFKPIVRPWSHLTKEIEHNGERFVPIKKLLNFNATNSSDYLCRLAAKKVLQGIGNKSISHFHLSALVAWHFDCFYWLNRTGPDGQPLAVEMEG